MLVGRNICEHEPFDNCIEEAGVVGLDEDGSSVKILWVDINGVIVWEGDACALVMFDSATSFLEEGFKLGTEEHVVVRSCSVFESWRFGKYDQRNSVKGDEWGSNYLIVFFNG